MIAIRRTFGRECAAHNKIVQPSATSYMPHDAEFGHGSYLSQLFDME